MVTIIGASTAGKGEFSPPSRNQGRTPPIAASNRFTCQQQTGERKRGQNRPVILARPRYRTFTKPIYRLRTRKGCSTMARTAESFRPKAFGSPLSDPPPGFLVGRRWSFHHPSRSARWSGLPSNGTGRRRRSFLRHVLVLTPRRTRGGDQRGIDDGASHRGETFPGKLPGHIGKDRFAELMLFRQVTETQDGAFVQHDIVEGIQPGKAADIRNVVQGFLHRRVGFAEPRLNAVDAQ